jgi:uncharacterized protein
MIIDADAHVIEPFGIFGAAQRLDRNPMDLPATTPTTACGGADLSDQWEHGFDAASYLRAMDAQGIDAAVLYPSVGLFVPFQPEVTIAEHVDACAGYDEWIASYCAHAPHRLAGVGIAPLGDPNAAIEAVHRARRLELVGLMVRPNYLHGRNLGDLAHDGFLAAMADAGLVLAVHEGLGLRGGPTIGADRFDSFAARHLLSHPMEQMATLASLILDGALERHPTLDVAFLESGTGWLPYWLARLDDHIAWMADTETAGLTLSATEYFARQCVISTDPEDPLCARTVASVGADHVMWASDFPHPDAAFPDALDEFRRHNPELDPADLETILSMTPLDFYDLGTRFAAAS